ncbi:MAG: proline dehydrogenase family protein [Bacteroidetes bacterium]|nr:proline dehydrogenase family protein [Bacteroidota bacterium]
MIDKEINLSDTQTAFQYKTDSNLKISKFVFSLFKYDFLVKYGPAITSFCLKIGLPIKGLIKKTVFSQFCGGENIDECNATVDNIWKYNVGAILDYSVEGEGSEQSFEANADEIKNIISKTKGKQQYPFCVFKPSGIASISLLEKVDSGQKLEQNELDNYYKTRKRFETLCETAANNNVKLFIDAEESWIQNSVDNFANEMMRKFNTNEAVIFNTVQLYRKGRVEFITECIEDARKNKYYLGFKLVRGAYIEKEWNRAALKGYENPIHNNKFNCDTDFNNALKICFENRDIVSICAGTHNENSSLMLCNMMNEAGIDNNDKRFWFAQLYGMSDTISFNLASHGYNVAKYLPYGPIQAVMPYLGRRARENSSMAGQMGRELNAITAELKRRNL